MIRVRFAPSPTGELHIGSARTALFNWLLAHHHKGQFFLRIEDTDKQRSTPENIAMIYDAMKWLELSWEGEPVIQSERVDRHIEVARALLSSGHAYRCACTNTTESCHCAEQSPPEDAPAAIRVRIPREGKIAFEDQIKGKLEVDADAIENFVILRSDDTPTYMLCVVVDDHDMGITHVIRGDDHITNTFKQILLYQAMGWSVPAFGHIPLIHGEDGAKLSKRHGALSVQAYRAMGILPEALCNGLLRLGWGHGDDEIISREQAIEWFDLSGIGVSPARFDMNKLLHLNAHYLRQADNERLVAFIYEGDDPVVRQRLLHGMNGLKQRARTLIELKEDAGFYLHAPKREGALSPMLVRYAEQLGAAEDFSEQGLLDLSRAFAKSEGIKLVELAQPMRILLTGREVSPSVFEIMEVLGKEEVLRRMG